MADRILVSTEQLGRVAQDLDALQGILSEVGDVLAGVNTSRECGGNLRIQTTGFQITGSTVADLTKSLQSATHKTVEDVGRLTAGVRKSIEIFEDAEKEISKAFDSISKASDSSVYGDSESSGKAPQNNTGVLPEKIAQQLRDERVKSILYLVDSAENNLFPGLIDWKWIKKNAYGGLIFTFLNGKVNQLSSPYIAAHLVDHLLDVYVSKAFSSRVIDIILDGISNGKKVNDVVTDIQVMHQLGDDGLEYLELFQKGGVVNEVFGKLGKIQKGSAEAIKIMNAINYGRRLAKMDPQVAARLRDGLLQSGDSASIQAANILAMAGDTEACMAYALTTYAGDLLNKSAKKVCEEALNSNPYGHAINIGVSIGTTVTDLTMNTTDIATSAQYMMSADAMRKTSADAVHKAVAAYQANPTEANYNRVQNAYEAYNSLAAETVDAYRETVKKAKDSLAGKIVYADEDISYLEEVRDGFLQRNGLQNDTANKNITSGGGGAGSFGSGGGGAGSR